MTEFLRRAVCDKRPISYEVPFAVLSYTCFDIYKKEDIWGNNSFLYKLHSFITPNTWLYYI